MKAVGRALQRAIAARKETRYRTAKGAGVDYGTLCRFLDRGADVRLATVEALADYLGLELKPRGK